MLKLLVGSIALALAMPLSAQTAMPAPAVAASAPLTSEVLRTSGGSLFANITLIKGRTKAVLVDAPFTRADAHRVVAMVLDSGLDLETIFITHDHPDHFFAMEVLTQAFPNARIVAHSVVVADIWRSLPYKVKRWYPVLGTNAPRTPTAPAALDGDSFTLEGHILKIIGPMQGDHVHATALWVPDAKLLVAGDLLYNQMFLWFGEHDAGEIAAWGRAVEMLRGLGATTVIAGHSKPGLPDDPSSIDFSANYIRDWPAMVAASRDSAELRRRVVAKYPGSIDVLGDFLLGNSSKVAKGEAEKWTE